MEPILYNAASGGLGNFGRQEVIANNLANVNTPGFKADLYQAQTMYSQSDSGALNLGQSYTIQTPSGFDLSPGGMISTGRNLDVAPEENAWFAVNDSSGSEAYTKAGNFSLDANGMLITASGKQVIGNGGPISIPPSQSINIGNDGTISVVPLGGDPRNPTVIDRIKMVKLDKNGINKNYDGLFQLSGGGTAPADNTLKLRSGVLEGSNVNVVDQMVAMITSGRDFETNMNLLSTLSENAQKLAQVLHE